MAGKMLDENKKLAIRATEKLRQYWLKHRMEGPVKQQWTTNGRHYYNSFVEWVIGLAEGVSK